MQNSNSRIRFLHAYPSEKSFLLEEHGEVDFLFNDVPVGEKIGQGEYTEWMQVEAGAGVVTVFPAGTRGQELVRNEVKVPGDEQYTIVLADREGVVVLAPVKELDASLEEGYGGIRFGHLVNGASPVRIVRVDRYENEEEVYETVEYGQITEYIMEEELPIAFDIYTDASEERVLRIPWTQYEQGMLYTVFLIGSSNEEEPMEGIILAEDR